MEFQNLSFGREEEFGMAGSDLWVNKLVEHMNITDPEVQLSDIIRWTRVHTWIFNAAGPSTPNSILLGSGPNSVTLPSTLPSTSSSTISEQHGDDTMNGVENINSTSNEFNLEDHFPHELLNPFMSSSPISNIQEEEYLQQHQNYNQSFPNGLNEPEQHSHQMNTIEQNFPIHHNNNNNNNSSFPTSILDNNNVNSDITTSPSIPMSSPAITSANSTRSEAHEDEASNKYNNCFKAIRELNAICSAQPELHVALRPLEHVFRIVSRNHKRSIFPTTYAELREQAAIKQQQEQLEQQHQQNQESSQHFVKRESTGNPTDSEEEEEGLNGILDTEMVSFDID